MGSFRRGAQSSHDVDVLLVHKNHPDRVPRDGLQKVLKILHDKKFLTDDLAMPGDPFFKRFEKKKENTSYVKKPEGGCTYMGVCWKDNLHRRVDIKWYPYKNLPFAQVRKRKGSAREKRK